MLKVRMPFDLVLCYPQWQGSGRSEHLRRGADACARVCADYGPAGRVPDAGEGTASGGINRFSAIQDQFHCARQILGERRPRRLLTAGGDCACDIAVIDYLHSRNPDLLVVWVDAHLDANTVHTSPSGNIHGMPVAAVLGHAPEALRPFLSAPLAPSQLRYVSAHVGDEGDWTFQREKQLRWLGPDDVPDCPVHIHFDLDSLDPAEFPHVSYPDGRLRTEEGLSLVYRVAQSGRLVGLTITEFAPANDEAVREGSRFIRELCEAATA